ncbi:MAG: hypothetical protein U0903_12475 [Planctomycetales bacterium]
MDGTLFAVAGWGEGLLIFYAYVFGFWVFCVCIIALLAMILRSPRISLVSIGALMLVSLIFQPWLAFAGLTDVSPVPEFANDYKPHFATIIIWLFAILFVTVSHFVAKYRDRHTQLPPSETL